MRLFYLSEHRSCFNYQLRYESGFSRYELAAHEEGRIDNDGCFCVLFVLKGEVLVELGREHTISVHANRMLLIPQREENRLTGITPAECLLLFWNKEITVCDKMYFDSISHEKPIATNDHTLPIRKPLLHALRQVLFYLETGLLCRHMTTPIRNEVKSLNTQIIAIANQKGGVGKTTTCANLGIGLAQAGKKVLLIDGDPQGSLTISLGHPQPDKLPFTLSDAMGRILMDEPLRPGEGILHHPEGVDLMPADIQLSGMEVSLVNAMSRETIMRQYLDTLKGQYSHILIDCQPSLGMLTVNALAAANRVIIPVQAEYLPAKGLEQLLSTVNKVKRQINPKLQIDGILLTMVDSRTNFAKEISALLRETYGSKIKVFGTEIPHSVRAKEISAEGKSIFAHDPGGKVAEGYRNLTKEVLKLEKQREKNRAGLGR